MISWYPVHPTNVNFTNFLINSDNKGRASMLFEERMRKEGENMTGKVISCSKSNNRYLKVKLFNN